MGQKSTQPRTGIPSWHRNLLVIAAVFTVLLIALGGILCVTRSIRNCPDWPGCFGKIVPPLETGPVLEYSHRVVAALSGLLIISAGVAGLLQRPRLRWIMIPPLVAILLLVEVSYFGARVVLKGLSPGWAAVDVGSALLVVALMITSAVFAASYGEKPVSTSKLEFTSRFSKLVLATTLVVYIVLVSGVLVAGKDSISGCLGWPIYSLNLYQLDLHEAVKISRLALSLIGIGLIISILVLGWHFRKEKPQVYRSVWLMSLAFGLEILIQIFLLTFGYPVFFLVGYTIVAAIFWGLLIILLIKSSMVRSIPEMV